MALLAVDGDSRVFRDKFSLERKLLSSCLYDFAKSYLARFSAVAHKTAFQSFWSFCQNLHPFENQFCAYKNREATLKALACAVFTSVVYSLRSKKSGNKENPV